MLPPAPQYLQLLSACPTVNSSVGRDFFLPFFFKDGKKRLPLPNGKSKIKSQKSKVYFSSFGFGRYFLQNWRYLAAHSCNVLPNSTQIKLWSLML
ncbi:hypothetical protein [Nostoc sp. LPT]|uniref:hypothetical protein n=1 Tax=Nostoc sp. LPT TaxID=2815387 RepID=UPI001D1A94BB|nr:hypothetical protein [Nostoc sp. LPT]MBN4000773.1 hypothetical protein [Nostoc sp. LPT]